jgi:exopolyphosphatase/guanosine-5'-triphosphate,3'-diphosphate pyrophosphatase
MCLDESVQDIVKGHFIFLRIAESLDRSHSGHVQGARFLNGEDGGVVLEISSPRECELEIWGVQNHCDTFEKIYGRHLSIRHVFNMLE